MPGIKDVCALSDLKGTLGITTVVINKVLSCSGILYKVDLVVCKYGLAFAFCISIYISSISNLVINPKENNRPELIHCRNQGT